MEASTYRTLIVDTLINSADWRRHKAELYPDDPRNPRSVEALEGAAKSVRELPDETFGNFIEFDGAMEDYLGEWWSPETDGILNLDPFHQRRVSRFGFGEGSFSPLPRGMDTRSEVEILLDTILDGIVSYESERISEAAGEVGFKQPPGDLVRLLEDWGFAIRWPEDDEDE